MPLRIPQAPLLPPRGETVSSPRVPLEEERGEYMRAREGEDKRGGKAAKVVNGLLPRYTQGRLLVVEI
jgi:hypothetical protein